MSMNRVVLAIIVLAFVSAGCDLCSDETVSSAPSPDGRLVAVITTIVNAVRHSSIVNA
jgi:hypothetical protein